MELRDVIIVWIFLAELSELVLCQCGGSPLVISAGESPAKFVSPGYPASYTNNLNCQWLIDSGADGQPVLIYSDLLDMDCAFGDFVYIYDGLNSSATSLQNNLCGTNLQTTEYISSDRYIFVKFVTNAAIVSTGFEMTYVTAADTSATGCSSQYTITASTSPEYLTSEGFPALYSSDSSCRWLIQASTSLSTINVSLVWSDIENDAACAYDVLVIYDGSYVCENQELLTDCSVRTSADVTPPQFTSSGDSVLVKFTSDNSYNRYGFIIKYSENFVNYTTTAAATTTTSTTASISSMKPVVSAVKADTRTETQINVPLIAGSAVAGAAFVLGVLATIWLVKYVKARMKDKKGLIHVHAIAPLPARTVFKPRRETTHVLSFV